MKLLIVLGYFRRERIIEKGDYDCHGNCLTLLIKHDGQLFFNGKLVDEYGLKREIKNSLLNTDNLPTLPDKKTITIENLGDFMVSNGVIDISADMQPIPETYPDIILIVKKCFFELKRGIC